MDAPGCPVHRDDRKSAALAVANVEADAGALVVGSLAGAREVMRNPVMRQAGIGAEQVRVSNPEHMSVFFLDGERHKRRRSAIAHFFTPKAISTRYRSVMDASADRLVGDLQRTGSAQLDKISFQLAAEVAAEIIGLTNSNKAAMAERIRKTLDSGGGTYRLGPVAKRLGMAVAVWHAVTFLALDVFPAILARRKTRRPDVLSHMLDERYSIKALLIECLTYGAAGMVTTREFIVMAAWHLLERDELRARFLAADEAGQVALLEEILRLEPIASVLHRRDGETGMLYAVDVRAANTDEAATGACPHMLDPDRPRSPGSYMSFGDGPHRCPGAQVALHESRIFLDKLLRVPGLRLSGTPQMHWRPDLMSYEIRDALVSCDRP